MTEITKGDILVLTIQVARLHGRTEELPLGGRTQLGQCSIVAIGYKDGGTVLRMDGGAQDYKTELQAPQGAEFTAAILANVVAPAPKEDPPDQCIVPRSFVSAARAVVKTHPGHPGALVALEVEYDGLSEKLK